MQESGERGIEAIERTVSMGRTLGLQRARGSEGARIEPCVEHGDLGAGLGDAIAMAARHAFDEAVQSETPEVVGHRPGRIAVRIPALELRDVIAKLPMPKPGGREREEAECVHERVDAAVAEAEAGGALIVDEDGRRDGVQTVFADQAIVNQLFDAQEAPVGGKADLPQSGQIPEGPTDLEGVRVVDGGFGANGLPFLGYGLTLDFLYCAWSEGTTPSVKTRVRKPPGVRRVTRRLKISCI